jgi:cytochrome c oxidase subunit 1/cytochrome c oxidase subunit I+III
MNQSRGVTVRELPSYAFGARDPVWWGVILLMAMEGTTLALSFLAYFYIRQRVDVWPTTAPGSSALLAAGAEVLVLLGSVAPTYLLTRATRRGDLRAIQRWMWLATLLSALAVAARGVELHALPFRWDSNAYASVVWGLLVLHTTHLGLGVLENLVFSALLFRGPVEKKHLVDLVVNGLVWYFVVAGGLAIAAVVYGEALLR